MTHDLHQYFKEATLVEVKTFELVFLLQANSKILMSTLRLTVSNVALRVTKVVLLHNNEILLCQRLQIDCGKKFSFISLGKD